MRIELIKESKDHIIDTINTALDISNIANLQVEVVGEEGQHVMNVDKTDKPMTLLNSYWEKKSNDDELKLHRS